MISRILLTTDLSKEADAAAPFAIELAKRYEAPIDVLYVLEVNSVMFGPDIGEAPKSWTKWIDDERTSLRRKLMDKIHALHASCPTRIQLVWREGSPAQEIIQFAESDKIDCIVMSTHGRNGLAQLENGSVAERVVRHSPCAVLTVRSDSESHLPIKRILLPTDFSSNADAALPAALDLACKYGAEIHLVHVFDHSAIYGCVPIPDSDSWRSIIEKERARRLNKLREYSIKFKSVGSKIEYSLLTGHPAREIVNYANSFGINCIVAATHGLSGSTRISIGCVAELIVRKAHCPVYTIRPRL